MRLSYAARVNIESPAIGVRRLRLARRLSIAGWVGLFGAMPAGFALMGLMDRTHPALIFAVYLLWLVPWIASYVVWFLEPKRAGQIAIEPAELDSALAVLRSSGPRVEMTRRNGDVVSVAMPSIADADVLVEQLGFGPGGRRQRVDLAAPKRRFLNLALGFLAYQLTSFAAMPFMIVGIFASMVAVPLMMVAIAIGLPFIYRLFKRKAAAPRLEIGDDGVTLLIGTRAPRFFARKSVYGAQVVAPTGNIAMNTAEGPVLVSAMALDNELSRAALHTMERRWSAPNGAIGPRIAAFERGGRPVEAWRAELASRIAPGGYRGDSLSVDEADAILRNPGVPADARVGAALTLAAAGERVRIADAAAPIADPQLRVALESIAEGRDEPAVIESATRVR